ncbi:MAG TPA: formate dehydrogenase accessory sulfurtransferase FdhD [Vicinamibacterales bacterium]|jgi:FdhD protein
MSANDSDKAGLAGPFPGLGYDQPVSDREFTSLTDSNAEPMRAPVAEEVPIAFVYCQRTHAVMMATPCDLEDLAVGFSLSESIVEHASEISGVTVSRHSRGIDLIIDVAASVADRLAARSRAIAGRTGCGLCGVEAIDDAVRIPPRVTSTLTVTADAIWRAAMALERQQPLNRDTHAIHGAAWATASGEVRIVREDVGRHNALDKVLGALARAGIPAGDGFVVVTSRASFELVQKAAVFGIPILAAISRPTGLAVRMADAAGMSLLGLVRGRSANVYAHPSRVCGEGLADV